MHSIRTLLWMCLLLPTSLQVGPSKSNSASKIRSPSPRQPLAAIGEQRSIGHGRTGISPNRGSNAQHDSQAGQSQVLSPIESHRRVAAAENQHNINAGSSQVPLRTIPDPLHASIQNSPSAFRPWHVQSDPVVAQAPARERSPAKFEVTQPTRRRSKPADPAEDLLKVGPGTKYKDLQALHANRASKAAWARKKRDENQRKTGYRTLEKNPPQKANAKRRSAQIGSTDENQTPATNIQRPRRVSLRPSDGSQSQNSMFETSPRQMSLHRSDSDLEISSSSSVGHGSP